MIFHYDKVFYIILYELTPPRHVYALTGIDLSS